MITPTVVDNKNILKPFKDDFQQVLERRGMTEREHAEHYAKILYHPKINSREGVERFKDMVESMATLGEDCFPLYHKFGGGVYTREVHLPKGYAVVGKIHKKKSMVYVLTGGLIVADENSTRLIKAPAQFECTGNIRRIAYILDDTIWIDIHSTDKETIEEAEAELFAYEYSELEYARMIKNIGYTETEVRRLSENTSDQIEIELEKVSIGYSEIEGKGIFATQDLSKDESIGMARIEDKRTQIGRFTNHSQNPNAQAVAREDGIEFVMLEDINEGEEVTVDYQHTIETSIKQVKQCQQ